MLGEAHERGRLSAPAAAVYSRAAHAADRRLLLGCQRGSDRLPVAGAVEQRAVRQERCTGAGEDVAPVDEDHVGGSAARRRVDSGRVPADGVEAVAALRRRSRLR